MKICDKQIFRAILDSNKQIFDTLNVINRFLEPFLIVINRFWQKSECAKLYSCQIFLIFFKIFKKTC